MLQGGLARRDPPTGPGVRPPGRLRQPREGGFRERGAWEINGCRLRRGEDGVEGKWGAEGGFPSSRWKRLEHLYAQPRRSMNGGRDAPIKVGDGGSRVRVGRRAASKWGELFYRPERQE